MNFGNNIEKMAFEKGEWPIVEISPDGNTIYMGKPPYPNCDIRDTGWTIKKIEIIPDTPKPGCQTIHTIYAVEPKPGYGVCWNDRYFLSYEPL